jgi:hypothetical protein
VVAKCEICMLKCIQLRILYKLMFAMSCFQFIFIPGLVLGIVTKYLYCNKFAGFYSQWKFITLKTQYTTVDHSSQLF